MNGQRREDVAGAPRTEPAEGIAVANDAVGSWTFLTNHAHVLICIARDPNVRLRDVATAVGITERAVQRIVRELEAADYLERTRVGRRNTYRLHGDQPLRHVIERDHQVGELLATLVEPPAEPRSS